MIQVKFTPDPREATPAPTRSCPRRGSGGGARRGRRCARTRPPRSGGPPPPRRTAPPMRTPQGPSLAHAHPTVVSARHARQRLLGEEAARRRQPRRPAATLHGGADGGVGGGVEGGRHEAAIEHIPAHARCVLAGQSHQRRAAQVRTARHRRGSGPTACRPRRAGSGGRRRMRRGGAPAREQRSSEAEEGEAIRCAVWRRAPRRRGRRPTQAARACSSTCRHRIAHRSTAPAAAREARAVPPPSRRVPRTSAHSIA